MLDKEIRKDGIVTVQIQQDFERCNSAGAAGMFQVISITLVYEDGTEAYHTDLIDQGDMFYNSEEVLERLKLDNNTVNVEYV
ncbi:MAG: hypothetical protein VZR53_10760 [Prevotella sp.]|nr:hypothetical protein [Prevotella sp.]